DLGSRKIRDEIDAMEVLGISPIERLVVPRVFASMFVAVLLNGLVSVVGVIGGYTFNVLLQHGTPGAYIASFTALAQLPDLWVGEFKALISGALAAIGGSVGVIMFMTFFTGTEVGLEGYQGLNQIGISAFAGFISAYFNTREIAPLVAGLALTATVGAGFTAQLGAMRISEEVDALEVMGIPSVPYLVTTRIIAGLVAVIPLYVVGLFAS